MKAKNLTAALVAAGLFAGMQSASAAPTGEWYEKNNVTLGFSLIQYIKSDGEELTASIDCNEETGQPRFTLAHKLPHNATDFATEIFGTTNLAGAIEHGAYNFWVAVDGGSLYNPSEITAAPIYDDAGAGLAELANPDYEIKPQLVVVAYYDFHKNLGHSKMANYIMEGEDTLELRYTKPSKYAPNYSSEYPIKGLQEGMASALKSDLMECGDQDWELTGS